jgi:hypothetical protein
VLVGLVEAAPEGMLDVDADTTSPDVPLVLRLLLEEAPAGKSEDDTLVWASVEAAPDTPSEEVVLVEALVEPDADATADIPSDEEEVPLIPVKNELVVPEARVVEGGSKGREDTEDGWEDEVEEADAESAEEELEPDWLTVELDAPEYGANVELLSPLVRLELWLDVLLPLPAFVVVAEDGDAELTFPDPEAEDGATVLALAVPDAKVDVMELTLVEAAAFDTEVPRYDVSSVVVFDVGTLLSDGLVELDEPELGAPDPRVDEDTADDDVVDVTVADGGLVDEAVDPDAADDPEAPVLELGPPVEAVVLDEYPLSVCVSDDECRTVGIAVLLRPEISAPEPELGAAEEVVLAWEAQAELDSASPTFNKIGV